MDFRTVAFALAPYIPNPVDLLGATDAVLAIPRHTGMQFTHDALVAAARNSGEVMDAVRESRKIDAIKRLRTLTSCGLKEAKDAIESDRVWGLYW